MIDIFTQLSPVIVFIYARVRVFSLQLLFLNTRFIFKIAQCSILWFCYVVIPPTADLAEQNAECEYTSVKNPYYSTCKYWLMLTKKPIPEHSKPKRRHSTVVIPDQMRNGDKRTVVFMQQALLSSSRILEFPSCKRQRTAKPHREKLVYVIGGCFPTKICQTKTFCGAYTVFHWIYEFSRLLCCVALQEQRDEKIPPNLQIYFPKMTKRVWKRFCLLKRMVIRDKKKYQFYNHSS